MASRYPEYASASNTIIYADEEREFLMAMDTYKREKNRPFPTWKEVLKVIKGLGYVKVAPLVGTGIRRK